MEAAQTAAVNQSVPPGNSPPPAATTTDPPQNPSVSRKRSLDRKVRLEDSPYYKMRAIVRDLRPHFLEVLKTPDFRNCKAAEEIRGKMKIVMDLYKEMIAEPPIPEESKMPASHPSSGEMQFGQHRSDIKPPEKPRTDWASTRHSENKSFFSGSISQKQQPDGGKPEGTYIVGGSAFGWNFVTFPGSKSIYYGRTKEAFRSANVKSQVE